jgi:DMSO/TMAO reductase YedYZ molybdopterin-dependent catalytic subunit
MTPSDDSLSRLPLLDRRHWLRWSVLAGAVAVVPSGCGRRPAASSEATPADAPMRFPGKVPMRVINDRPPCLETPWEYYRHDLTPNEAFYVRWHLQVIPTRVDVRTWRLRIGGNVERPLELSLDELRRLEPVSVVAVNQCSGNSRGLFKPPIPGAQWFNGGMGNARWTGVRLRDLLARAGLKAGAVEIAFAGMDRGGPPGVPDFVKSLKVDEARRPEILLAYEMNGEPLPLLNGFPLRLVVPGWYATYWLKALESITALSKPFDGFWMAKAYRIPTTPNAIEKPDALAKDTVPIHRMNVRSFFTSPAVDTRLKPGQTCELDGIAFDGGSGIRRVEVSTDAGRSWQSAALGKDLGPYSFRRWRLSWQPEAPGEHRLLVRATSNSGETQPHEAGWNRAGYMRNVIEALNVTVG